MKILTLTTKDFFTGISESANLTNTGLWHKATGINPFIDPSQGSINVGLLQTSPIPTAITGGVGGTPLSSTTRVTGANAGTAYIGTTAGISQIDISGDNNATTTLLNASMANGLELFQPAGATTEYLYYWQTTQIGRWGDLNGVPADTPAYVTGLQDTPYHPTHKIFDRIYYGNKDRIGRLIDDGAGGVASTTNALNFESNKLVTCLEDDGDFLVIGLTENQGDNSIYAKTTIRFWDGVSDSWNIEWTIPDVNIIALKRIGTSIYAICPRSVYVFNRSTAPKNIKQINSTYSPTFGRANSVGTLGHALLWGSGSNGTINLYGSTLSGVTTAFHQPFTGGTGSTTLIVDNTRFDRILVGTDAPALYRYDISVGGGLHSAETVYIPLSTRYDIKRIEVTFGEPLAVGDILNIDLQTDEDNVATDFGTISYALHGAIRRKSIFATKINVDNLKMIFNFNGGNIKIKQIEVFGDHKET